LIRCSRSVCWPATAATADDTLSLHDALPIWVARQGGLINQPLAETNRPAQRPVVDVVSQVYIAPAEVIFATVVSQGDGLLAPVVLFEPAETQALVLCRGQHVRDLSPVRDSLLETRPYDQADAWSALMGDVALRPYPSLMRPLLCIRPALSVTGHQVSPGRCSRRRSNNPCGQRPRAGSD